jgi:hypothetical protein
MGMLMSNRGHIVSSLHLILLELWEGSEKVAAGELRKLISWTMRAAQPSVPTMHPGMFCAPVLQVAPDLTFLESALTELIRIEAIWKRSAAQDAKESVKGYLASLSEDPASLIPVR